MKDLHDTWSKCPILDTMIISWQFKIFFLWAWSNRISEKNNVQPVLMKYQNVEPVWHLTPFLRFRLHPLHSFWGLRLKKQTQQRCEYHGVKGWPLKCNCSSINYLKHPIEPFISNIPKAIERHKCWTLPTRNISITIKKINNKLTCSELSIVKHLPDKNRVESDFTNTRAS